MIKNTVEKWLGEVNSSNDYENFENEMYGVRAALVKLRTMYTNGAVTIRIILKRWHSPVIFNLEDFTSFVEKDTGYLADQTLKNNSEQMCKVLSSMSMFINGSNFGLTTDQIEATNSKFKIFN